MKRFLFCMVVVGVTMSLFAQTDVPEYHFASGRWNFACPRLYQNDANARLDKVNLRVPQSGPMVYEFNARYEGGVEDGHGGFGMHIFVDNAYHAESWGAGNSYLLWLNYDETPGNRDIPVGLSAQIYRSISNSQMELVESISLNEYLPLLTDENLAYSIPFKIEADGNTGEIRVYDPTNLSSYLFFFVDRRDLPLRGNWVALRTNGIRLSFGMGLD
jgi:hypothetical protein